MFFTILFAAKGMNVWFSKELQWFERHRKYPCSFEQGITMVWAPLQWFEGSVRGGPKTGHMGRRLAGARNGPNRTLFQLEIVKDLAPVRTREIRFPGPVRSGGVEFDVVWGMSAVKLRFACPGELVASICHACGSGSFFGAGSNQRISAFQTSRILDLFNFAHHDRD